MHLEQLDLIAYGPFTETRLDFSGQPYGLHLVFGPNEAGKSSALSAYLDFLFGFPNRSEATFKHGTAKVRVGASLGWQGQPLSLVRRKGRKETLLTKAGDAVSDQVLDDLIGNLSRKRYELEFGINYSQLTLGGRELAAGKGELAAALFAAASGSDHWSVVKQELESRARDLFLSRGALPEINQLLETLRQKKQQLGDVQLLPAHWEQKRDEVSKLEGELRQAEDESRRLQKQLQWLQYQDRLKPLLENYFELRQVFLASGIRYLPDLSTYESWEAGLDQIEQDYAKWQDRQQRSRVLQQKLQSAGEAADQLGPHADQLESLLDDRAGFSHAISQLVEGLPVLQQLTEQRESLETELHTRFSRVTSSESDSDLESEQQEGAGQQWLWQAEDPWYLLPLTVDQFRELNVLVHNAQSSRQQLEHWEEAVVKWQAERDRQPVDSQQQWYVDCLPLAGQVGDFLESHHESDQSWPVYRECQQRMEQLRAEQMQIRQQLPELDIADWEVISQGGWPSRVQWEAVANDLEVVDREIGEAAQALAGCLRKLDQLKKQEDAVYPFSDRALEQSRQTYQELWRAIRRYLVEPDEEALNDWLEAFRGQVVEQMEQAEDHGHDPEWQKRVIDARGIQAVADLLEQAWSRDQELQQQRVRHSDRIAEAAQLQRQLQELQEQRRLLEARLQSAENRQTKLQEQWQQKWSRIHREVSLPVVKSWDAKVQKVLALQQQIDELHLRLKQTESEWESLLPQLSQLMSRVAEVSTDQGSDFAFPFQAADSVESAWRALKQWHMAYQKKAQLFQQWNVAWEAAGQRLDEATRNRQQAETAKQQTTDALLQWLQQRALPENLSLDQWQSWLAIAPQYQGTLKSQQEQEDRLGRYRSEVVRYLKRMESFKEQTEKLSHPKTSIDLWDFRQLPDSPDAWCRCGNRVGELLQSWKQKWHDARLAGIQQGEWREQWKSLIEEGQHWCRKMTERLQELSGCVRECWAQSNAGSSFAASSQDEDEDQLQGQTGPGAPFSEEDFLSRLAVVKRQLQQVEQYRDDAEHLDARLQGIGDLGGGGLLNRRPSQWSDIEEVSGADSQHVPELELQYQQQQARVEALTRTLAVQQDELEKMQSRTEAVELRQEIECDVAKLQIACDQYLDYVLAATLLDEAMTRFSRQNQHPILRHAGRYFEKLTLGSFQDLRTEVDVNGRRNLVGVRRDETTVPVGGMSEGTESQLYLALRLAALRHYLEDHPALPFVVDDVLKDYDDQRALAALKVLAELGESTQVIVFTHHEHLLQLVQDHLEPGRFRVHRLQSGHAQTMA